MTIRCEACGQFMSNAELDDARFDYTPLNEFGPEVIEFTHRACDAASRIETRSADDAKRLSPKGESLTGKAGDAQKGPGA